MDSVLHERLFVFMAGREGKADSTIQYYLQRLRHMANEGFSFDAFAKGEAEAQAEGDRFLVELRRQKKGPDAIRNVQKCLKTLTRFHAYRATDWRLAKERIRDPQIYNLEELRRILSVDLGRSEKGRRQNALIMSHLALGWRSGELVHLEEPHVDAANSKVFLAHPEKGNPQRWIPIHATFFNERRAFGSWLRHRPTCPTAPQAVWTYTTRGGAVKTMRTHELAKELAEAGRKAGVRANCQRGRPTCLTADLVQRNDLAFVRHKAGHANFNTLAHYLAWVNLGMANHLRRPGWFAKAPTAVRDA